MNKRPLLSVIIPCYKVEKFLDRCMESVVNQTYADLEIILIDDGSPDSTGRMCDRWAERDIRIKVIHKENGGLGFARNSGLEVATGEYVAFIDSDDYIDIAMYEKLMSKIVERDSDIVYCGHVKQLHNGETIEVRDFPEERVFEKALFLELSQGFFRPTAINPEMLTMSVWHAIYHRSVITTLFHSEREVGSEDIHFQLEAMLNARRVMFIPDALYVYCYNGESLSHEFNLAKYDRYKSLNEIINATYARYGIESPGEYCVFIMAFAMIRRIALSKMKRKDKKKYAEKIVKDQFWTADHLDSTSLRGAKKIFYKVLKLRSVAVMMLLADIYCLMKYTLAKKGRE